MPTFGKPETAVHNPPEMRVMHIQQSVSVLDARRAALMAEWSQVAMDCDHHFVPANVALGQIPVTDAGVRYAGVLTGYENRSTLGFELRCTKCPAAVETSLSEHCPECAHELSGRWVPLVRPGPYPGSSETTQAWLASCSQCGFTSLACMPLGM